MHSISRPLILASSSPRRQYLLKEAGYTFATQKPDVDETYPSTLPADQVAKYLAEKKAAFFTSKINDEIVITADTVVIIHDKILNKPQDKDDAVRMLQMLSGQTHIVITGVCLLSKEKQESFQDVTEVTFKELSLEEIEHYIDRHQPFDKAGAYGAQDWVGMVAIQKINGSYFNVMGLPVHKVYEHLSRW